MQPQTARRFSLLALVIGWQPGCQLMSPPRPVTVLAQDAETKQPIPGAQVQVVYAFATGPDGSPESAATAGPDGVARLRTAVHGDTGVLVEASASGYLNGQTGLSAHALKAVPTGGWFQKADDGGTPTLVVELYAGPSPTVDLVVPAAFRGLIKADVRPQDNVAFPAGQRQFRVEVPASGEVVVTGPTLLRRVTGADFTAHWSFGDPLNRDPASDSEVGLRWLRSKGSEQHFVVGTRRDFEDCRREAGLEPNRNPYANDAGGHGQGGKGSGRGNRGGRGGSMSNSSYRGY